MKSKPVEILLKEKKIFEIVNPKLNQALPETSIEDAVRMMQERRAGYLVVAKDEKVVGLFTETDVIQKILDKDVDWTKPVSEFMTPNPPVLKMHDTVGEAIDKMVQHQFYFIPLVDEKGELVNVLSVRSLIKFLAEFYPTEIYNLPPNPNQVMTTQEGG